MAEVGLCPSRSRFALLTNVRETDHDAPPPAGLRSRGDLVTTFLTAPADETLAASAERIGRTGDGHAGFNLLLMHFRRSDDGKTVEVEATIVTNRPGSGADEPVAGRSCVMTNGAGSTWPKITLCREALDAAVEGRTDAPDQLIAALLEGLTTSIADVDPRYTVGVSPRRHQMNGEWYTTRSQLVVLVERDALHPRAHVVSRDAWVAGPDGEPVWSGREHGQWTLDLAL